MFFKNGKSKLPEYYVVTCEKQGKDLKYDVLDSLGDSLPVSAIKMQTIKTYESELERLVNLFGNIKSPSIKLNKLPAGIY